MMRPLPPLTWRRALVLLALALALWLIVPPPAPTTAPHVELAFFGFIISALSWLLGGLGAAASAIASAALWLAQTAWAGLIWLANALSALAGKFADVGRKLWSGLKATYEYVLRPAWQKFWTLVDRVRRGLERIFKPVIDVLTAVRRRLLELYTRFVRPVLDIIDVGRKVLRVLAALHLDWARKLDAELATIEGWIDEGFQRILRTVNEAVEIVNRVVTLDGLIQRLALIRSIERDLRYVSRALGNWRSKPLTEADYKTARARATARTVTDVRADLETLLLSGDGLYAPIVNEMVSQLAIYLRD